MQQRKTLTFPIDVYNKISYIAEKNSRTKVAEIALRFSDVATPKNWKAHETK